MRSDRNAGEVTAKRSGDQHSEVTGGSDNTETAFGAKEGRQECRDGTVSTLGAGSH
jgi:hypothetical protein